MLKWVDGFSSYSGLINWLQYRYASFNGPSSTFVPGRAIPSGNALSFNGTSFITPNFTNQPTYTVGFAFQNVNLSTSNVQMPVLQIRDGTTAQIQLSFNPFTKVFSLYSGATLLGTGTFALTTGYWYYIEVQVTINATTGTAVSHVNTVVDVNFGPGNTQQSANAYAQNVGWFGPANIGLGGAFLLDDMYICDGTGSVNNTFLGDMKVEGVHVLENGTDSAWGVNVPNTPEFTAVQVLADGLNISSNTAAQKATFVCGNLNFITSAIAGVQAVYWTRNTDSTVHQIQSLIIQAATPYLGAAQTISNTAFNAYQTIWEADPNTTNPWTVSGVGTAQYGVNLVS